MYRDERWELFECKRCGRCCTQIGLPYDPWRIFEIAKFLNLEVAQVIEKYYGRLVKNGKEWESEDFKRTPCPFLKTSGDMRECAIYGVRPIGCELYPFGTDGGRCGVECPAADIVYAALMDEEDI